MKVIVNGEVITEEQINQKLLIQKDQMIDLQMGEDPLDNDERTLKIELANEMIDELLLVQYGLKKNYKPNDEEVEIYTYNVISQLNEEKDNIADYEYVKQNVYHSLVIEKVRNALSSQCQPESEQSLEEFYQRNRNNLSQGPAVSVRHILFKLDENNINDRSINLRADEALNRLKNGEDFSKIAFEYSDCPSKNRGGDLGFITVGVTDKEFEKTAFELDIMEISPIIETEHGFHILQVLNKEAEYIPPFESIKDKLQVYLAEMFCEDALYNLIDELRDNAEIEYLEV